MLRTILVVILILMLLGSYPGYGYNAHWGYGPVGGVGLILVIILVLLLFGRL